MLGGKAAVTNAHRAEIVKNCLRHVSPLFIPVVFSRLFLLKQRQKNTAEIMMIIIFTLATLFFPSTRSTMCFCLTSPYL
jgi:chromate transport protein ChrA